MENWRSIQLDQIMATTGKKPYFGRGGPNIGSAPVKRDMKTNN